MKTITLGASELMSMNFYSSAWTDPRNRTAGFPTLAHWQEIARVLDEGGFDFLFFADVIGYPMSEAGMPDAVIRGAVQTPSHDPLTVVSGLAATVERLNFVVTASTTAERPFMHARRFATLDHLTQGRIGWNIVNSDNQIALVRLLGLGAITEHDTRYDRADEFVDLCSALWEGSWQDDAVVIDRENGVFADPDKVHPIAHHGRHFDLEGIFTVIPSPQRTPTLFQAGASPRGRSFAARTAECVYVQENSLEAARSTVADIRARAVEAGRLPSDIKILNGVSVVVASTLEEAEAKREALRSAPTTEMLAMHFLGWTGIDLLRLDPELPLTQAASEYGHSTIARYDDGRTVGRIIEDLRSSLGGLSITGTPEMVADAMERYLDEADLDGFLVEPTFGGLPGYCEFIDLVVPELRRRGRMQSADEPTTLRQRLFGGEDGRVNDRHRSAPFRVTVGA
ncbi:NtaA/DmoA family FMN-dependent monooxygenase [Rathayibacter sp. VKM Ac-2927]|uniref:NtaA/DmoA family FMN-dependent monooxygenase n=1 Tax=Rathayibacter sp. VKM Ac-2927 TaxID=2929478 RepID=UPI001FB4B955|nr:NtaA/DmoA family FMN-dependent monooxygenase [Rathayibacter sp. VKM Ac-2927]MCJ1688327.1 NtaA/DmoA family FMN-dependent monooxygenase [Rathayibacter sp. VKM Ac-2927]